MKILFYGLNYAPELTGIGKYSGEMCEWLADNGHEVQAICAPPYYPEWQIRKPYKNLKYVTEQLGLVKVFRCPLFVPQKPKTINRLLHLASFAISSFPVLFKQWHWKPDVVICIEPTFFCVPGALLFSKISGSPCHLHIQDFELDAMLGLGLGKSGFIARMGSVIERWLMRRFNTVSAISFSMVKRADQKMGKAGHAFYFSNWVDTDFLTPYVDPNIFRKRWNISDSTRVILYSGNIGKKQGLDIVLDAANELKNNPNLLFLIVGTGAALDELKQFAEKLLLNNVMFQPLQAYADLPSLMALADIHLVIQKRGAADAVLPSKLTSILSVGGNSIITAEPDTELGLLCQKFPGIAECIEPENAEALTNTIQQQLTKLPPRAKGEFNQIARQFALDNLKKDQVLKNFVQELASRIQQEKG
ncbi:MAG: colanic acid biosynthesis glycosyltransferase WcaI [Methylomonas sp.]|nr:MAG: colanic acid biosynthesis glycosyltransferase WcaI [Methylomonas sp.]